MLMVAEQTLIALPFGRGKDKIFRVGGQLIIMALLEAFGLFHWLIVRFGQGAVRIFVAHLCN